jgi:hypothetical protein
VNSLAITVEPLGSNECEWAQFLADSFNGTLFHDLRFLRYHPMRRFRFHHLMFRRNGRPIALLPGGLSGSTDQPIFCSPLGASIGGPAVAVGFGAELALNIITALQNYARDHRWAGIEMTLPPACYDYDTAGAIEFALFSRGFRVVNRWLCPMIRLVSGRTDCYEQTFRRRQITSVRSAKRKNMIGIESGLDVLDSFLKLFRETYARHGVSPTHTADEIRYLLQHLPERIRIHLAMFRETPVAGILVFTLNASVAYTFYICSSAEHIHEHGAAFIIADLIDRLSNRGFRYLDLGPSASDKKFNKGVTFFKEGMGAAGHCRDRWLWEIG